MVMPSEKDIPTIRRMYSRNWRDSLKDDLKDLEFTEEFILALLDQEPVIDCVEHTGDRVLGSVSLPLDKWLGLLFNTPHGADLLRLLGRVKSFPEFYRETIVKIALDSKNICMRDAAMQAVESWKDKV